MSVTILTGDAAAVLPTLPAESVDSIVTDPPAGIAFMGKTWDTDKGGRDAWIAWLTGVMTEAHRVLKPGGHALVWALPRTAHWTATALEDAGFEIRDCVIHMFGTGFPKGMDVSKAIDRASGAERVVVGLADRKASLGSRGVLGASREGETPLITAPATPDAGKWEGWNTALKPGHEQWWLVRKSLRGTVAANVVTYGTGALNVDGCRIVGSPPPVVPQPAFNSPTGRTYGMQTGEGRNGIMSQDTKGRWPANLVFTHSAACEDAGPCADDCPVGELDTQSGDLGSSARPGHAYTNTKARQTTAAKGAENARVGKRSLPDARGVSRFFPTFCYQPKAARSERPTVDGVNHPTVKSLDLMRWLVRLITPPGGTVLDLFAGSGTTMEAAVLEGFSAIGIEAEADYIPLIRARLARIPNPREGS